MIVRQALLSWFSTFISLFLYSSLALAQYDSETCLVTVDGFKFDLKTVGGEHTLSRRRESPPTSMIDSVRLDLCGELKPLEDVSEQDQCPSGTRVCLTTINKKANEGDRIVSVVPIVQSSTMDPSFSILSSSPRGLFAIFHGPEYPNPLTNSPTPQSLNLTLLCNTEASDPVFKSYDNSELRLEWSAPAGCSFKNSPDENDGGGGGDGDSDPSPTPPTESVGSGIGWFFLVAFLAIVAYFVLGAYYNYSTYGATGFDLIPHRDFWQEVPYMFRDVVSHLCSSGRPRHSSSRGGYISV